MEKYENIQQKPQESNETPEIKKEKEHPQVLDKTNDKLPQVKTTTSKKEPENQGDIPQLPLDLGESSFIRTLIL